MLESSVGYKGLIPRISYSRYFSIDNAASNEKIQQETRRFPNNTFCAGSSRQNSANYDNVKPRNISSIELKKNGVQATESKTDTSGNKYLLSPPQKFKTTTASSSPREKLRTIKTRPDIRLRDFLPSACSMCSEFSTPESPCSCEVAEVQEQDCLKLYNGYQARKYQRATGKSSETRPRSAESSYQVTDEEMQREKIINSWMQFFG
ncbi:hypothetical protein OS493_027404 [Desmophyllum pertusum]|uniref:Uncharacterized protein n=1 Tax=Desmophyllum pertusum TaxID=174260 RepID=A0A9W9YKJ5_9CNID|nr:hypothetical protein OS493_027404 [Desmophyllum pertusum]